MDITVGLQVPPGATANNASGAVTSIQQTNGANNAARNANVVTENQPPASTRVTISEEGQARLSAEQAAGAQAATPAAAQEAALTPAAQPVTQTAAAASVETGASAAVGAVGQGATQAAASTPPTAPPAAEPATATNTANASAPAAAGTPTTNNAQPATPETSTAVRQAVDDNAQQAQVRQSDAAAARQDASPVVAQAGANAARSALAA